MLHRELRQDSGRDAAAGYLNVLQLRPNCECCDRDLPPESTAARICSFECTFCEDCVNSKLQNVCPNCGGGFVPRPIRPSVEWREGLSRYTKPPSADRVHMKYSVEGLMGHIARIKDIPPEKR